MRAYISISILLASAPHAIASDWVTQKGVQAFVDIPYIVGTVDSDNGNAMLGFKCYKKGSVKGHDVGGGDHMMLMVAAESVDRPKDQKVQFALRADDGTQTDSEVASTGQQSFVASGYDESAKFTEATVAVVLSAKDHFGILLDGNTYAFSPKNTEDTFRRMVAFCDERS